MKTSINYIIVLSVFILNVRAQDWKLKIHSQVELRTWKLTTKADKDEKRLPGATILLTKMNGGGIVSQLTTDEKGEFIIEMAPNEDYILTASYPNCNSKRFTISTKNVPEKITKEFFTKPFHFDGFIMCKPFPGIDYSGLKQSLVKICYSASGQKFDQDKSANEIGFAIMGKVTDDENTLINKFCNTNKEGDQALAKPDCPLAKTLYERAIATIPGEEYPVEQLKKVGLCLKEKEDAARKAETEKEAKVKEALAKQEAEKRALEKKEQERAQAAKLEAEKKTQLTDARQKEAEEKALADKLAKEKKESEIKAKAEAEKIALENKEKEKQENEKKLTEKKAQQALEKENKATKETAAAEKARKQKEGLERSKAEDDAAMKADQEKAMAKRKLQEEEDQKRKAEADAKKKEADAETASRNAKTHIPQVLGKDMYKENIKKGDDYFKTKRYREAKASYEEALKSKNADPYCSKKIEECIKLMEAK